MKYLPLVLASLLRKPLRSVLTASSVAVAFVLFGVLEGIDAGFSDVIEAQYLDRLLTDTRVPGGAPIPISAADKIKQVPGVTRSVPARASLEPIRIRRMEYSHWQPTWRTGWACGPNIRCRQSSSRLSSARVRRSP